MTYLRKVHIAVFCLCQKGEVVNSSVTVLILVSLTMEMSL